MNNCSTTISGTSTNSLIPHEDFTIHPSVPGYCRRRYAQIRANSSQLSHQNRVCSLMPQQAHGRIPAESLYLNTYSYPCARRNRRSFIGSIKAAAKICRVCSLMPQQAHGRIPAESLYLNTYSYPCARRNRRSFIGSIKAAAKIWKQCLLPHWRRHCFRESETAAMRARCRAPRIPLHQGAARGVCPLAIVSVLYCRHPRPAVPLSSQPLQETSTSPPPDQGEIPSIQNPSESQKPLGAPRIATGAPR